MSMKEIKFSIGGLFEKHDFFRKFLMVYNTNRDKFYDYISISSLFGCIKCNWNGGRIINDYWDRNPEHIANFMKEHYPEIDCRLTFTNAFITKEDLSDKTGNTLLGLFNYGNNSIIVYSDILEEYIRKKYPKYNIISSITKTLDKEDTIRELGKDYYLVVLNSNLILDDSFISNLPNKQKIEILVNDACSKVCPDRLKHYLSYSKDQRNNSHVKFCNCDSTGPLYELKEKALFVSNEKIQEFADMNIVNFKIQGRTNYEYDLLETLVYYLVKPEYALEIREKFMLDLID